VEELRRCITCAAQRGRAYCRVGSAMHAFKATGWIAVALGVVIGSSVVLALDEVEQARTRSKLQQIADDAAISGVLALASNAQREAYVAQHEATVAVTNQVESKIDGAGILVRPESTGSTVSVEVSAPLQSLLHNGNPVTVTGKANYLPPAQPQEVLVNRLHGWRNYAQYKQE
jgi:hypothetical protein